MNVNDFDRYISNYLDGELNSSKTKEFEELLNNHAECNEKFISYKKMLNELSNLESIKTSEDFLDKLYQRINNVNSLDDLIPEILKAIKKSGKLEEETEKSLIKLIEELKKEFKS